MGVLMVILAQIEPLPTVAEAMREPPAVVGDALLKGRGHGPIVAVIPSRRHGLEPPGIVEIELIEKAERTVAGCSRQRWTVGLHRTAALVGGPATPTRAIAATEIALPRLGVCPYEGYVHVAPGIPNTLAFEALARLEQLRTGSSRTRFSCSDATASQLCASQSSIRSGLATIAPWALSRSGATMVFWLGVPGQVVTEVRFDIALPDHVRVSRRVPPPA